MLLDEAFQIEEAVDFLPGEIFADGIALRAVRKRIDLGIVTRRVDRCEDGEQSFARVELVVC